MWSLPCYSFILDLDLAMSGSCRPKNIDHRFVGWCQGASNWASLAHDFTEAYLLSPRSSPLVIFPFLHWAHVLSLSQALVLSSSRESVSGVPWISSCLQVPSQWPTLHLFNFHFRTPCLVFRKNDDDDDEDETNCSKVVAIYPCPHDFSVTVTE